jgi:hypothetical protein
MKMKVFGSTSTYKTMSFGYEVNVPKKYATCLTFHFVKEPTIETFECGFRMWKVAWHARRLVQLAIDSHLFASMGIPHTTQDVE